MHTPAPLWPGDTGHQASSCGVMERGTQAGLELGHPPLDQVSEGFGASCFVPLHDHLSLFSFWSFSKKLLLAELE